MRFSFLAFALTVLMAGVSCVNDNPPGNQVTPGPHPKEIFAERQTREPAPLAGPEDLGVFIQWAAESIPAEREVGRKIIVEAAENEQIAQALIKEVESSVETDHSRALVVLAILGEMRNPAAEPFFVEFIARPLPETGTMIEGEIVEKTALAMLQAKAVECLAYLKSESGDREIFRIVAEHESIIVRAAAVNAYLWNHQDEPEASSQLAQFVRDDERVLLNRVRREPGESSESFNRKLERFLKQYPELRAPAPEPLPKKYKDEDTDQEQFDDKPPQL